MPRRPSAPAVPPPPAPGADHPPEPPSARGARHAPEPPPASGAHHPLAAEETLTILPLTPARWPDLEAIFTARGCSVARGCWCMWYRVSGQQAVPDGSTLAEQRKAALRRLVDDQASAQASAETNGRQPVAAASPAVGLLAYRGATPVGWVTLGPRADFAKLRRSAVMKPVDDVPVWSIVCFVVPGRFRGQGVARQLLQGAIEYARSQGAGMLEAYPVDKAQRSADDAMWFGAKSMFDAAGFTEVARRKPARPVVRLPLREPVPGILPRARSRGTGKRA